MEHIVEFDPELNKPINVTDLLEKRHIKSSVKAIMVGLEDYCSAYSQFESAATTFLSDNHLWISIGDVPLSKRLKDSISQKFQLTNGKLLFKNWESMKVYYPDVLKFKYLHGKKPAFVGFPLPEEDSSGE